MNSRNDRSHNPEPGLTDELHPRLRGDKRWFVGLLALCVGLTVVVVASRPVYRHLKVRRAQQIAQDISARLDAGAGTNGLQQVRLMLSLAPADELVLRAAARYCTTNQQPDAVTYWEMLLQSVPGSREDHLAYAQVAMDLGRYEVATRELATLLLRPGGDVEAARLALRLAMKRGSWEFASRMADHVLQLAPDDGQAELWRGLALVRTRQPARIAEAKSSLLALMFRPGGHWREAVDALLEAPGLSRSELGLIRSRLADAGMAGMADQLRARSVDWRLDIDQPGQVIAQVLRQAEEAQSGSELQQAGRWLLLHGAAEQLLGLCSLERSRGDRVKMQLHILALARLGRWEEVAAVAGEPHTGLDAHVATVMSVAAARLRPNGDEQTGVRAVLADRKLQVPALVEAVQLAEENGLNEAAIYLLESLLDLPATMPEAANRILALAGRVDRLGLRRHALERLVNAFPKDPLALQQLGYVEAVLPGGELGVIDRVERLPGSATNQFAQLICALGEVRRGKADAALARLSAAFPPDPADGYQDYRVHLAYAAAHGLAGDQREARQHAALAAQAPLQLEERALISLWLPDRPR